MSRAGNTADRRNVLSIRTFLLIAAVLLGLLTTSFQPQNSNTLTRLATAQALVARGTFAIDNEKSTPENVDKVLVRGSFYSDKPPGLALLVAAVYYPLYHAGLRLDTSRNLAYGIITFLLIGGSTLLCLAAFYSALGLVGLHESGRMLMTAGLAFATLMLPWSTTLNNHVFSGSWIFVSFYLLLNAKTRDDNRIFRIIAAGAAAGLAASADSACALFVAGFGIYILLTQQLRRATAWYLAAAILMMLPSIAISHAITGDFRPMAVHSEYFHYPGSYWNNSLDHLSGVQPNGLAFAFRYALFCLAGPNGFHLYNPLLLIALYFLVRRAATSQSLRMEALLVLILGGIFAGYFFLYTSNYSGASYSIRWFVTLIPLLWFFGFPFFENWTVPRKWVYLTLCFVSVAVAFVGALNQWPDTLDYPQTPAFVLNWRSAVVPRIDRMTRIVRQTK